MLIQTAIFKIGGKILDNSKNLINTIAQFTQLFEDNIIKKIILIPGGGLIVNFLRNIYREFHFKDELAHWIAIYAMDFNGTELKRKFSHLKICDDFEEIDKEGEGIFIFLPYKYLKKKNELPQTWDVTSDSITIFLAKKFNMKECFLIKDVEGIIDLNQRVLKEISTVDFRKMKHEGRIKKVDLTDLELKAKATPIDPYLLTLIDDYKIPCIVLNGGQSNPRIFNYFVIPNIQDKVFTKIYSI